MNLDRGDDFREYDIVIYADSLLELQNSGWRVKLGSEMSTNRLHKVL